MCLYLLCCLNKRSAQSVTGLKCNEGYYKTWELQNIAKVSNWRKSSSCSTISHLTFSLVFGCQQTAEVYTFTLIMTKVMELEANLAPHEMRGLDELLSLMEKLIPNWSPTERLTTGIIEFWLLPKVGQPVIKSKGIFSTLHCEYLHVVF